MIVQAWNAAKSLWSRLNDWIMQGELRRPVPKFVSPEAIGVYLLSHARYTGDLLGGAGDNYTHPERFQAVMEGLTSRWVPIDCDDYAIWAFVALRQIPGVSPVLITLRDAGVVGSHVICVYRQGDRFGAIDTAGWRPLPDITSATLCRVWTESYASLGYRYVEAQPTPYPF